MKRNQLPLAPSASLAFRLLGYCSLAIAVLATRYSADAFSHGVLSIFGLVCGPTTIAAVRFDNLFSREQTTLHRFLTFENTAAVIPTHPPPPQLAIFSFFEILFLCHWL